MKVEYSVVRGIGIARISGRLDGKEPGKLRKELPVQIKKTPDMVLDCSELEYVDSTGLGALLACLRIAVSDDGDLRLAEVTAKVNMLLELTKANMVFQLFPSVGDAVASYEKQGGK